jgi:hypothetical protein
MYPFIRCLLSLLFCILVSRLNGCHAMSAADGLMRYFPLPGTPWFLRLFHRKLI